MGAVGSPEVELFASTTRAFLNEHTPVSRTRELHARGAHFDRAWWRRGAELGWTSLLVPDDLGGGTVSGNGVADLAMIAEQMGSVAAPGPLLPVNAALTALVDAGGHADVIASLVEGSGRRDVGGLRRRQTVQSTFPDPARHDH